MLAVLDETMRVYPPVPDPAQRVVPRGGGMIEGKWVPEGVRSFISKACKCNC